MTIVVIRHGETALNRARVVQPADTPLSDVGQQQAQRLAGRASGWPVAAVLCSDLPRARMTAAPMVAALDCELELTPLLQERNFGDLRGTPYAELEVDIWARDYHPPGGETWEVFEERVARAWDWVVGRADEFGRAGRTGHVVVVTHGLVCRTFAARHWELPGGAEVPRYWHNTSVSSIARLAPHRAAELNCAAHLDPSQRPDGGVSGI
ncbi:MAG: histidine phosphatase family protein [Myxococcales bacterium]|nr:histidine phosphatase family protein [Myxococcales bacterium]